MPNALGGGNVVQVWEDFHSQLPIHVPFVAIGVFPFSICVSQKVPVPLYKLGIEIRILMAPKLSPDHVWWVIAVSVLDEILSICSFMTLLTGWYDFQLPSMS